MKKPNYLTPIKDLFRDTSAENFKRHIILFAIEVSINDLVKNRPRNTHQRKQRHRGSELHRIDLSEDLARSLVRMLEKRLGDLE